MQGARFSMQATGYCVRGVRALAAGGLMVLLWGCAAFFSLEPQLNEAVGVYAGESRLLLNARSRTLISDDGERRVMRYTHAGRCAYIVEMDSRTFVVHAWRYTDEEAAASCRRQPSPVYV